METFIPGICLFIVSILAVFMISPHLTPFITAILAILFLTFGVHQHYQLFASEYRLSTWQEGLKLYAPAVMIIGIILFLMYGMVTLFSGIRVPIPEMPDFPEMPDMPDFPTTNSIKNSFSNLSNRVSHMGNNLSQTANSMVTKINNSIQPGNSTNKGNSTAKGNAGKPFSLIETI
jgi:hypothetical protein